MTYAELQAAILSDTHRPDLASEVPRFIRECEGMIRRSIEAYFLTVEFGESARLAGPRYNLPQYCQVIRSLSVKDRDYFALEKVSLDVLQLTPAYADVIKYAMVTDRIIEFAGNPGAESEFVLEYYGAPDPLVESEDTNTLLEEHESLYLSGSKFWLYGHTQDLELQEAQLQIFNGVADTLNELAARQLGGASVPQFYNFGSGSAY